MNHISIDQNPYEKPVRKWLAGVRNEDRDPDEEHFQKGDSPPWRPDAHVEEHG